MKKENGVLVEVSNDDIALLNNNPKKFFKGVKFIGDYAFSGCSDLTSIVIPRGVKSIESHAFAGCPNLKSITILGSLQKIGESAFEDCSSLTSVMISKGAKTIWNYAFSGCSSLSSVIIPKGVKNIRPYAFLNCSNLFSIKIPNGVKDIGYAAFRNCSSLTSVIIPESVEEIGDYAFEGCSNLSSIVIPKGVKEIWFYAFSGCSSLASATIPSTVKGIGRYAFAGANFSYISKTKDGSTILSEKPLDWEEKNIISIKNISKLTKVFDDFDIGKIVKKKDLSSLEKLANILSKNKLRLQVFAEQLNTQGKLKTFVKNVNFRFFKNEVIPYLSELNSSTAEEKLDFYKFANALGCFSSDKILDRSGRETKALLAQKASSFLANILKREIIPVGKYHELFDSLPLDVKPDQEFLKFISLSGDKKFQNLDLLLNLEKKNPGMFVKVLDNFDKAKSFRLKIDKNLESPTYGKFLTVPWEDALEKFYLSNKYLGVDKDSEALAEILSSKGASQELFNRAVKIRKEALKSGVPSHILGKELKEETIIENIERIKNDTENQIIDSKDLIENLFAKQFTYEMLDKYDPHNPIMGFFSGGCATIDSVYYGKNIAKATIKAKDVQNLVIKNSRGEIIAKGTMYVNSNNGYAVINDFEINSTYKRNEKKVAGYYKVSDAHKEEKRELIFKAFQRGVFAFVKEYDAQNSNNPIKFVHVGMGYNKLKKQTERLKKASQNLTVPVEYSFRDAAKEQRILYSRKETLKKLKEIEGEQIL